MVGSVVRGGTRFQGRRHCRDGSGCQGQGGPGVSAAADAQPLVTEPGCCFPQVGVGGLPILLYTPSPDPLTPSLQHAGASQLHPKLGSKLGPFCLAAPRSQPSPVPLRDLRFTGPREHHLLLRQPPLFLVLILGCEVTLRTSPSPTPLATLGDSASS